MRVPLACGVSLISISVCVRVCAYVCACVCACVRVCVCVRVSVFVLSPSVLLLLLHSSPCVLWLKSTSCQFQQFHYLLCCCVCVCVICVCGCVPSALNEMNTQPRPQLTSQNALTPSTTQKQSHFSPFNNSSFERGRCLLSRLDQPASHQRP